MRDIVSRGPLFTPRIWTFMKYNGETTAALQLNDFAAVPKGFCGGLNPRNTPLTVYFDRVSMDGIWWHAFQLCGFIFLDVACQPADYLKWLLYLGVEPHQLGSQTACRRWNNSSRSCEVGKFVHTRRSGTEGSRVLAPQCARKIELPHAATVNWCCWDNFQEITHTNKQTDLWTVDCGRFFAP